MPEVITFGEAMIRLSPPHFQRLEQTATLDVQVGGGELNVAVGVARLGLTSAWVSRLPQNALGRLAKIAPARPAWTPRTLVWTSDGESRMGLYFLEFGAAPRASTVLYDRRNSAISAIRPGEVDWKKVMEGARWFHVSGITPALSDSAAAVTREALQAAKQAGLTVSYDLNYRGKLWTPEKAQAVQEPLMEYRGRPDHHGRRYQRRVQNQRAKTRPARRRSRKFPPSRTRRLRSGLQEKFHFQAVAITLRENPLVWRNTWTAIAYADGKFYDDVKYELEIVDRLGGGDSFSAGFIYGRLKKDSYEAAVRYGNAFSALKHSMPGDFNWATLAEVESLLKGSSLRVAR